ncbi:MAG TPA: MFS transporter [Candidatus Limnocylindria bacterium]|nr:MFS transporter [Candidatus Limnocylindria bacterium]
MKLPEGLAAFRHRNFRLFWAGMLVSLIGTWMQQVGQAWLVLQLTDDPLALGLVAMAQFGPILFLGPIGGILADSISKRKALMVTQTCAGLLALVLAVLYVTGHVQVWHIFVLAMGLGIVNSFDMPIRQAFVIEMVGRPDIANAVALNSTVFNITRIIGPAIAGLTIAGIGIEPLFFVNAASYLAVVVSLVLMRPSEMHPPTERAVVSRSLHSVVDLLVEGVRYTRNNPGILLVIALVGAVSTFAMNYSVLIPVVARDVLHGDADTYGFLMSAAGLGSLVSALSIAFRRSSSMNRLFIGAALCGFAMVGVGISRWLPLSLAMMFVAGWGGISMAATANTTIQLAVPDVLRGRVVSLYTTVFVGSTPIGGLFSGLIASGFGGAPAALIVGGSLAAVSAFVAYLRSPGHTPLRSSLTRTSTSVTPDTRN